MADLPLYLRPRQVAEHVVVDLDVVYGWIARGELAAADVSAQPGIGKARWRVSREDLLNFLQRRRRGETVATAPKPRRKARKLRFY